MQIIENLIVGAGPAGLAIAGRMSHQNIPFEIIDARDKVASAWHDHYDRLHLHTVKQWSHLPHLPFPENYPLYVPKQKLIDYFEQYINKFNIKPSFNKQVEAISKMEKGRWKIELNNDEKLEAKRVIIATGTNRVPNVPTWENQENFKGKVVHSKLYKNAMAYKNQKVLVVGMGNTGAEIALDLAEQGNETYLSVRGPVSIVPRDLNGRPVQVTSKQLEKLPFGFGRWLGTQIRKLYFGNLKPYGLQSSSLDPISQLKETGKTPVVDIGTVAAIKAGKIKVIPAIKRFLSKGVLATDGTEIEIDAVILATGYRAKLDEFIEHANQVVDENGLAKFVIGKNHHTNMYFLGFDNYKLGGLLGTIYSDSETIVEHIKKQVN